MWTTIKSTIDQTLGRRSKEMDYQTRRMIQNSGLFDAAWYLANNPDVAKSKLDPMQHYLQYGWRERRSPSPDFDIAWYLTTYPDVAASQIEPITHYVKYGLNEGRHKSRQDQIASIPPKTIDAIRSDGIMSIISSQVAGQSVLYVGDQSELTMERLLLLISEGATSARVLSTEMNPHHEQKFNRVCRSIKWPQNTLDWVSSLVNVTEMDTPTPFWQTRDMRRHWSVVGHLYETDLKNKISEVDIVILASLLIHEYEPVRLLRRAAELAKKYVYFDVPITHAFSYEIDGNTVAFEDQDLIFAGHADRMMTAALDQYWTSRDIKLSQFTTFPEGMTRAGVERSGLHQVWWWFFGIQSINSILNFSGLQLESMDWIPDRRAICICATKKVITVMP